MGGGDSAVAVARETLQFVLSSLGAKSGMFYWADDTRLGMKSICVDGRQAEAHEVYRQRMYAFDPLGVGNLRRMGTRFETLSSHLSGHSVDSNAPFLGYLDAFGYRDILEMAFWRDGRLLAGLSVTESRDEAGLLEGARSTLPHLHRYLEFTLGRVAKQQASAAPDVLDALSPRERDVARLVCAGMTNSEISTDLAISLATTKTHVRRIFDKAGVDNRASLVALLGNVRLS